MLDIRPGQGEGLMKVIGRTSATYMPTRVLCMLCVHGYLFKMGEETKEGFNSYICSHLPNETGGLR